MHTRVSISSRDVHAITRCAFIRSTLHFPKQGERGLVLGSNIYLCWNSSHRTTQLCSYPAQRLHHHRWDGLLCGPNPFSSLLCNRTTITFWVKLCPTKWPHFSALFVARVATEIQAELTFQDMWENLRHLLPDSYLEYQQAAVALGNVKTVA